MARLTDKQKRFVEEYLVDLNATQAAARAGYKDPNIGRQLISKNNVSEAIEKAKSERSERTEITQDMVLRELAAIGFARVTDYVQIRDGCVHLTQTDELSPDQKRAVASIREGRHGIEVKLYDKIRALEKIGEHLGMFDGKTELDRREQEARIANLEKQARAEQQDDRPTLVVEGMPEEFKV